MASSGDFIGMAGICLDRLLKQRSALRKPDCSCDFPPPRDVLTQNTQIDTEVTEASRKGTERSIGVNAIAGFTHQVNPNSPRPDSKGFLCELLFVLSGLCDEIGLRNLGLGNWSVRAGCIATKSRALSEHLSQARQIPSARPRSESGFVRKIVAAVYLSRQSLATADDRRSRKNRRS
jgi:hypothetical protein